MKSIAALGLIGATLLVGSIAAAPQAQAATYSKHHHVRHTPRYFNQAPIEGYPSAIAPSYSGSPGWHDPSGCGMRCF
jgi:hypothetical protein